MQEGRNEGNNKGTKEEWMDGRTDDMPAGVF
jgi:hypothetical protein